MCTIGLLAEGCAPKTPKNNHNLNFPSFFDAYHGSATYHAQLILAEELVPACRVYVYCPKGVSVFDPLSLLIH